MTLDTKKRNSPEIIFWIIKINFQVPQNGNFYCRWRYYLNAEQKVVYSARTRRRQKIELEFILKEDKLASGEGIQLCDFF